MLYRRNRIWWSQIQVNGVRYWFTTKKLTKRDALLVQEEKRAELLRGATTIETPKPILFREAAATYIKDKEGAVRPRTLQIEKDSIAALIKVFGSRPIAIITAEMVNTYIKRRTNAGVSPKTASLEVGTLRAILRRHGLWERIKPHVRLVQAREIGRCLSPEEEEALLRACEESRSRTLAPVVTLALYTGLRYGEVSALQWRNVDMKKAVLTVGNSKTEAGKGRMIPLSPVAMGAIRRLLELFPDPRPEHYVIPAHRVGIDQAQGEVVIYDLDRTSPLKSLKEGWEAAKKRARVECRWHDLRHTFCTRMVESGIGFPLLTVVMGWSPATAARMAKRYGHPNAEAMRPFVDALGMRSDKKADMAESASLPVRVKDED